MDTQLLTLDQLEEYGYRRSSIVDHTLDDAQLEARCPLDNGRHHGQPKHPVGRLDLLPIELIAEVLLALDVPSLTAFRRVNRQAMGHVDSLPQYLKVFQHCPNILRAIVSINAHHFDCRTLFRTLCTIKCATCDRFGCYLYLITCKRVCYDCFTMDSLYFPVSFALATKRTGLARRELKGLPYVLSLPGRFTGSAKLSRSRIMLLDREALLGRASEVSARATDEGCWPIDYATREPRRYMCIISAPYFTPSSRLADWGFYFWDCIDSKEPETSFRNKYTEDGFREHMALYGINHGGKH